METKTEWKPEGELTTPYLRACQEWDARIGAAIVHARNWRLATFASLLAVLTSIGGLIALGLQPKAVPHIIEVDRLGQASYLGPVGEPRYTPPEPVLKYHLRRFLEDTRSVSSDVAVLKRNWLEAYALATPRGGRMLTAYVGLPENDPFRRAVDERVAVELLSAVRVTADTWQLDWRETTFDKNGNPSAGPTEWRGMFNVMLRKPTTAEQMAKNPIGLYVDEFHWDKVSG